MDTLKLVSHPTLFTAREHAAESRVLKACTTAMTVFYDCIMVSTVLQYIGMVYLLLLSSCGKTFESECTRYVSMLLSTRVSFCTRNCNSRKIFVAD